MAINNEEFNKAITNTEREVKGYVEVIYNDTDNSQYAPSFPEKALISGYYEINDGYRKNKNYASLEENYTELDGSFLLPNKKNIGDKAGYISNKLFKDITDTKITLNIDNPLVEEENRIPIETSGITIYFFNNIAYDFELKITDKDDKETTFNIKDNRQSVFHQFFENDITIKKMELTISSMEYPNRRIRISEIDFGISNLYEDNELISFTTNEEIDILKQSVPINDCTINLNNYNRDFDPLNPQGLVKYLTQNCIIKPFVGVLVENDGVDYRSLGYYYLNNWNANAEGNVTLNGQSVVGILNKLELKSDNTNRILSNSFKSAQDLNKIFKNYYNFTFSLTTSINFWRTKNTNLMNNIIAGSTGIFDSESGIVGSDHILFVNRNNIFSEGDAFKQPIERYMKITLNEMLEEPKSELRQKISKINFAVEQYKTTNEETKLLEGREYVLNDKKESVWFNYDKFQNENISQIPTFTYTSNKGGSAQLIDNNTKMCYIQFNGSIGEKYIINLTSTGETIVDNKNTISYVNSKINENGQEITYDFTDYQKTSNVNIRKFAQSILNYDKEYKFSGNFNGNPLIEPRTIITLETKFGDKIIIITKITNTFDGGLTGYFEGVEL